MERAFAAKPFTDAIRSAASKIRNTIEQMFAEEFSQQTRKLIVFHFRGAEKTCVPKNLTPDQVLDKMISYGAHKHNTTLYLMTDAKYDDDYVIAVREFYSPFFVDAKNFSCVFDETPFRSSGFLVFAVELELQNISDGYILTYESHKLQATDKTIGVLGRGFCGMTQFGVNDTAKRIT